MGTETLGIRANLAQFAVLVLVNGFVGAMVGVERTVLPSLAREAFGLASSAAAVSFLASLGMTKALGNLAAGGLADRWGRCPVLVAGRLAGLPAPVLILFARSWSWVVAANVLLGIQQALCWSVTVIMKLDLAGSRRSGMATGIDVAGLDPHGVRCNLGATGPRDDSLHLRKSLQDVLDERRARDGLGKRHARKPPRLEGQRPLIQAWE